MRAIPELVPISQLRQRQSEVLARLSEGRVILTQHGQRAAVLVGLEQWNRMIEALEDLQDALDAALIQREIAEGEEEVLDWDVIEAELKRDLESEHPAEARSVPA
jgi:prevent-host-death family protein